MILVSVQDNAKTYKLQVGCEEMIPAVSSLITAHGLTINEIKSYPGEITRTLEEAKDAQLLMLLLFTPAGSA